MAQLCQHQLDLDRLKVRVLIISFSAPPFARQWLVETKAPFPLFLDENREIYQRYGLERSFLRSWSPKTIWYYLLNWKARPKRKLADDLNQLGGGFIVDAQRILRLVYPSYEPVDRPSMNELFSVLETC